MPKAKEPKDTKVKVSVLPKTPPVASYNRYLNQSSNLKTPTPRSFSGVGFRVTQHKG